MRAVVITISDSAFDGQREDLGGPEVAKLLITCGYTVEWMTIVPDRVKDIQTAICHGTDKLGVELVVTTGGTGMSPSDVTPEATEVLCDKKVPGISEMMRIYGAKYTERAILSRGVCGIRKDSLVVNLPGNPKAIQESFSPVIPAITHGINILKSREKNCGN